MKRAVQIMLFLLLWPAMVAAQTEVGGQRLSGTLGSAEPVASDKMAQTDSLALQQRLRLPSPSLLWPVVDYQKPLDISQPVVGGGVLLGPLAFYGTTEHLTGLMDVASGQVSLVQHFGRWQLTASAVANKYWMSWQHQLSTQYGVGGTVGYQLNNAMSLHAFGYYYATNPIVGPAMSPYIGTTNYGGYADVRFSDTFGSKVGVRRYLNPMSGRWTTEPIVNPYIKLGDAKIELPLGGLLKSLVWGDADNPMRFQSRPAAPPSGRPLRPVYQP